MKQLVSGRQSSKYQGQDVEYDHPFQLMKVLHGPDQGAPWLAGLLSSQQNQAHQRSP